MKRTCPEYFRTYFIRWNKNNLRKVNVTGGNTKETETLINK
jgi:hypothetical protein